MIDARIGIQPGVRRMTRDRVRAFHPWCVVGTLRPDTLAALRRQVPVVQVPLLPIQVVDGEPPPPPAVLATAAGDELDQPGACRPLAG